jgi:hypothetical protein
MKKPNLKFVLLLVVTLISLGTAIFLMITTASLIGIITSIFSVSAVQIAAIAILFCILYFTVIYINVKSHQ